MQLRTVGRFWGVVVLLAVASALLGVSSISLLAGSDPWSKEQTMQPADLAKEVENAKAAPAVVFVGFQRLYTAGHVKGAQYHGTAGSEQGLKELTAWASSLPRTTNLVIYCGCCPMERCPNIRPSRPSRRLASRKSAFSCCPTISPPIGPAKASLTTKEIEPAA